MKLGTLVLSAIIAMPTFANYGRGQRGHSGQHHHGHHGQRVNHQSQLKELTVFINQHTRGPSVIHLKQKLKMQYPRIDLSKMKLKQVILKAKSKHGRGLAKLVVGQGMQPDDIAIIPGNPRLFQMRGPRTLSEIVLSKRGLGQESLGKKWQVHLQGNIIVKKATLLVQEVANKKEIEIPMGNMMTQGLETLKIKKLIKSVKPNIDLSKFKLKKVKLIAKSKRGRGTATLVTGQTVDSVAQIGGSPGIFNSNAGYTFDQIILNAKTAQSQGVKWQVDLQGKIKVKKVVAILIKQ